jgi:hypothetical protein
LPVGFALLAIDHVEPFQCSIRVRPTAVAALLVP